MGRWRKNPKLIGTAAYFGFKILNATLQLYFSKDQDIDLQQNYIFAFWHGKQLLPSLVLPGRLHTPMCAMVSPSRDGTILTTYLNKLGFEVVRGSSRTNNVAGLINIRKKLLQGASVGFGVDGPIGPIYGVKPGVVYLAQKCNIPIIPMGSAFSSAWTFNKAWDKFQIPTPFAKVGLTLDTPFVVPKDMDMQLACEELALRLHASENKAAELLEPV